MKSSCCGSVHNMRIQQSDDNDDNDATSKFVIEYHVPHCIKSIKCKKKTFRVIIFCMSTRG